MNLNGIATVFMTLFNRERLGGSADTLREHDRKVMSVREIILVHLMRLIKTVGSSKSSLGEELKSLDSPPAKILFVSIVSFLIYRPSAITIKVL